MARFRYQEGDWFAVPLGGGGYAVGIIARRGRGGVLFGYFFGPRHGDIPSLAQLEALRPDGAILVGKFGHLGLKDGTWPILGRVGQWERSSWPLPPLVRYEELTGRSFRAYYDDSDPNRLLREERIPAGEAEQGPKEGLMGYGFVELVLTKALT